MCLRQTLMFLFVRAGICSVWIGVYYVKYRWRKDEEETRQMYDMVESIVGKMMFPDVLQTREAFRSRPMWSRTANSFLACMQCLCLE